MRHIELPLRIFIVLSFCIACADSDDSPVAPAPPADTDFMPLAVGNSWVWQVSILNPAGETTYSDLDSLVLRSVDSVAGEAWYLANNWYYYIGREDGLWWGKEKSSAPSQLYKAPVVQGEKYDLVDQFGKTVHYTVLDLAADITVQAGTFTCWQFHLDCTACGITDTVWIAPGIGEVRTFALLADGSQHHRELLRYSIEGK